MSRSKFDKETIRDHLEFCVRTGIKKNIRTIEAVVNYAYDTGSNDAEIKAWLYPEDDAPVIPCPACSGKGLIPELRILPEADPTCQQCFGTGMEHVPGKGVRQGCACLKIVKQGRAI
jgi:hypothetical protein